MKLLLLDRPKDVEIIQNREVEYFGPWAQPITYPDDLQKPRFEPYPTPGSVYNAGIRSVRKASEILDVLYSIMPEITGVKDKTPRFWDLILAHHVIITCGIIEDIFVRLQSLPAKDYILGVPADDTLPHIPESWSEAIALNQNDSFQCWATNLILEDRFKSKERIEYNYHSVHSLNGCASWSNKIVERAGKALNDPNSLYIKWLKFYRTNLSVHFKNPDNIHSLIWDHMYLFLPMKDNGFIFRENLIQKNKVEKSPTIQSVDSDKREQIKSALPSPVGDLLAQSIPISAIEGLRELVNSVNISSLKKYKNLDRIYSFDWQIITEYDFWRVAAALLSNEGLKLMAIQPEGMVHFSAPVTFSIDLIFDKFISCGEHDWNVQEKERYFTRKPQSMPSLRMHQLRQFKGYKKTKTEKKKKWKAIMVVLSENKRVKWLYSPLFSDMAYDYFERQKVLFGFFQNQHKSLVKLYPFEYGWGHKDWIATKFPELQCKFQAKNFLDYIQKAEIAIADYNSSAFMEMLTLGFPFLCTWSRRWFKGNDLFESCVDKLEQVGVYYDHPEKLIEAYDNSISNDVEAWWGDKKRIQAVEEVGKHLALASDKMGNEWSHELSK